MNLLRTLLYTVCIVSTCAVACKLPDIDRAEQDEMDPSEDSPNFAFEEENYPTDALREHMIGHVHHVVDGDTLDLEVRGKRFKIRFKGSSAPECHKDTTIVDNVPRYRCVEDDEYYGLASYEELLDIIGDSRLRVECESVGPGERCEQDHYDRWLANLVREDGVDIGEELLRRGAGFTSTSFPSQTRKAYCLAEYEAREKQRGMWKGQTVDETIQRMNGSTQHWYRDHDRRCDEAIGAL